MNRTTFSLLVSLLLLLLFMACKAIPTQQAAVETKKGETIKAVLRALKEGQQ